MVASAAASSTLLPAGAPPSNVSAPRELFVFATFTNDPSAFGEGLHVLASLDGLNWHTLAKDPILLAAGKVGTLFRDPSIMWHHGWFHLVFTTDLCAGIPKQSWECNDAARRDSTPARFGYARSRNLLDWQGVRTVTVPLHGACNVWAPEWYEPSSAESKDLGGARAIVVFSATVKSAAAACPVNWRRTKGNPHRPYYMGTADFDAWSSPSLLFDAGESAIDTVLHRPPADSPLAGSLFAVYKAESNECADELQWPPRGMRAPWRAGGAMVANRPFTNASSCRDVLRLARATSVLGPFEPAPLGLTPWWSNALSRACVEGPTVLPRKNDYLVIYDGYRVGCPHASPPPCKGALPRLPRTSACRHTP